MAARRAGPGRDREGPGGAGAQRVGRVSSGCARCTAAARVRRPPTTSRSRPTSGPGVGLVRGGAGTALVGSHEEVADRLEEYHRLGIDEFILSGYPHVEEAYWFAEGVMPLLRAKGIYGAQSPDQAARLTRSA